MADPGTTSSDRCTWCGDHVEAEEGFRLEEQPGERHAAFCRLEHVVPWAIQGPHWEAGGLAEPSDDVDDSLTTCAQCGERLGGVHIVLVRHRGEHRIPDAFCSVEHLEEWAKAGGRWR